MVAAVLATYTILILLGTAFGVASVQWLIAFDSGDATPRCARCRYPADGLSNASPCPECGSSERAPVYINSNPTRTRTRAIIAFSITLAMVVLPVVLSAIGLGAASYVTIISCPIAILYMLARTVVLNGAPRAWIIAGLVPSLPAGFGLSLGLLHLELRLGLGDPLALLALIFLTPPFAAGAFGWWVTLATILRVRRG